MVGLCPACLLQRALAVEEEGPLGPNPAEEPIPAEPEFHHRAPDSRHRRFGDYELKEELGRGGMGIIFRATHLRLNREVALKVVLAGPLSSPNAASRLRIEAEAAARLDHPHIVPIYEVGEQDGQPFYTMRLVEGPNLAQALKTGPFEPRRAAALTLTVAHAVQHAHERGVLHRDLKPSNILLDPAGEPHVTDFGLARLVQADSTQTFSGAVLGTPGYMAPEQAGGGGKAVTTAADVYSVGAILYELLTGQPPFRADTPLETIRNVLEREPERPVRLNPAVDRDLETICLKCLAKVPRGRYASASALAEDLERWLARRPIRARPPGVGGHVWLWCRRRPALAAMSVALAGIVALGFVGVLSQWQRAERNADAERAQRQQVQAMVRRLELERVEGFLGNGRGALGLAALAALLREDPGDCVVAHRLLSELTHRNWALPALEPLIHAAEVNYAEFSPDGARLVTACMDNAARLWDAASGQPIGQAMQHDTGAVAHAGLREFTGNLKPVTVRFSPDGRRVATGSIDGTARVWDGATGKPLTPPLVHAGWIGFVQFSPDGGLLATASNDGTARLWRVPTGEAVGAPLRHEQGVVFADFSPAGDRLLTGADDGTAQIWEVATARPVGKRMRHGAVVKAGRFSPDGQRVATASQDRTSRIWDAANGEALSLPLHHENQVVALAFSPDGGWLATASLDFSVRLWNGRTGTLLGQPLKHAGNVRSVQFSPEGERLLTAAEDGTARLWNPRKCEPDGEPINHPGAVWCARFSPDGQKVVTASSDRTAQIWDVRPGAALLRHLGSRQQARWVRWAPDGKSVAIGYFSPHLFDAVSGRAHEHELSSYARARQAEFSPDGQRLAVCAQDQDVLVWDVARDECALRLQGVPPCQSACFNHDGKLIVTGHDDGVAAVWDAETGRLLERLPHPPGAPVTWAEFSTDDRLLLTESHRVIRVWHRPAHQTHCQWQPHAQTVTAAHFSPDSTRVVTASEDGSARVWDADSGAALTPPLQHRDAVLQAWFSRDGTCILTASRDNTARLWDARTGLAIGQPLRHEGAVLSARFSPDGRRLVTASADGSVRLWDGRSGEASSSAFLHPSFANDAEFSPDGARFVTACQAGGGYVWDAPQMTGRVPDWLPNLSEAVAGQRLTPDRTTAGVAPAEYLRLKRALARLSPTDPGAEWLHWFIADRSRRSTGPGTRLTVPERMAEEGRLARAGATTLCPDLPAMLVLKPSDGLLYARAARIDLASYDSSSDPQLLDRADWLSRRAIALAAQEAVSWWVRADVESARGDRPAALALMARASALPHARAEFWFAYAVRLESDGRNAEAISAYTKAVGFGSPDASLRDVERRRALLARFRLHARAGRAVEASADQHKAYDVGVLPRDPHCPPQLLDLAAFYNANIESDWRGMRFLRHNLSRLPQGRQRLGGIEFDVRGAVQLTDEVFGAWELQYPSEVKGIPVGQRAARIHFLHATATRRFAGMNVGRYTMHLANGQTVQFPLVAGTDLACWELSPDWHTNRAVVAWEGTSPAGMPVRLFHSTWTNLTPAAVVNSIDFDTPKPCYSPFLVAITIE